MLCRVLLPTMIVLLSSKADNIVSLWSLGVRMRLRLTTISRNFLPMQRESSVGVGSVSERLSFRWVICKRTKDIFNLKVLPFFWKGPLNHWVKAGFQGNPTFHMARYIHQRLQGFFRFYWFCVLESECGN